ncbi:stage III sporulation protein AD [uncultured Tyzzerella sp.]|uniref:stage III sporulation protein AD n=1 Tax=uncultured Tyzzerella sp. TaxID=2321398 RepID=UPI002941DD05|nr:stage III sporulation protein AD [uncultured Tyzzerella sp.]
MDIFKICIIAIISVIIILTIKPQMANISVLISIVSGVIIFMMVIPILEEVISSVLDIVSMLDIGMEHIGIILKIIGISYICEFSSQICIDAGESAIASKIELAGKVLIMFISIPVITRLLSLITSLMP